MFTLEDCYISYLNLDHRVDRLQHITNQLAINNLLAERTRGKLPNEFNLSDPKFVTLKSRTPGAIGCMLGQMDIMQKAYDAEKNAFVMEDDIILAPDFRERLKIFSDFTIDNRWDILWLGGTYHKEPVWHKTGHSQLPLCKCTLNEDWRPTDNKHIVWTWGCWSTYCYIVNLHSIKKVLTMLENVMPYSIGIDYSMILLEPKLRTFAFVPGMAKQRDNISDIGTGITYFSGFQKLGLHWYADSFLNFDYNKFYGKHD